MKKMLLRVRRFFRKPLVVLILAIPSSINLVKLIIDTIKMPFVLKILPDLPIFQWEFLSSLLQVIIVYVLYRVLKAFLKAKQQINEHNQRFIAQINDALINVTSNLNHSHNKLAKTIRYVDLKAEVGGVDNDSFIEKLHEIGLSKEDLQEIGVNEDFLKKNDNKLLPKNVLEKYKDLKDVLDEYQKNIKQ